MSGGVGERVEYRRPPVPQGKPGRQHNPVAGRMGTPEPVWSWPGGGAAPGMLGAPLTWSRKDQLRRPPRARPGVARVGRTGGRAALAWLAPGKERRRPWGVASVTDQK